MTHLSKSHRNEFKYTKKIRPMPSRRGFSSQKNKRGSINTNSKGCNEKTDSKINI